MNRNKLLAAGRRARCQQDGVLERLLEQYADQLAGNFVVATESTVRIVHLRGD